MTTDTDLHRDVGELDGKLRALTAQVDRLSTQVEQLNAIMNKGRGVQFALLMVPAAIGIVTGVLGYFGIKLTIGH